MITNIEEGHLGDFGSQDLNELLDIKWILSKAVRDAGTLILNADDALLRDKAKGYPGKLVWFSLSENNAELGSIPECLLSSLAVVQTTQY